MIIKLSKMSESERAEYMKKFEDICLSGLGGFKFMKPADDFDNFGLRFPLDYLNTVGVSIIFLPVELMADYVDGIAKKLIDDGSADFIKDIASADVDVENNINSFNATGIGNMAYFFLNCKDEQAKNKVEDILNRVYVKVKGMYLNELNEKL